MSARRSDAAHGQRYLRFAFCRSLGVLRAAGESLAMPAAAARLTGVSPMIDTRRS